MKPFAAGRSQFSVAHRWIPLPSALGVALGVGEGGSGGGSPLGLGGGRGVSCALVLPLPLPLSGVSTVPCVPPEAFPLTGVVAPVAGAIGGGAVGVVGSPPAFVVGASLGGGPVGGGTCGVAGMT